jgi:hypothetical protein
MELVGVDLLRLTPHEFWSLDLREYDVMLEAAIRRENRERRFQAAMTAAQLNAWGAKTPDRKPITAEYLLGIPKGKKKPAARGLPFAAADPEAKGRMLSGLMERIEKKRGKQTTSTA